MSFLLEETEAMLNCGGIEVLKVIKFIWELLDIVFILIPIGLILFIALDFAKNVIAGKEDEMKKNMSIAIKRIIYCIAIFLVEVIVQFAINLLGENGVSYAKCINIATTEDLSQYESTLEKELHNE